MIVYKYRGGNENILKRDLSALEHNYFWGSGVDQLNDPCEALLLSDKFDVQASSLKFLFGNQTTQKLTKVKEALVQLLETNKKLGVYSLSQTYKDELLWAHYANSHHGFCIEYDLHLIQNGYRSDFFSFPIIYKDKPPEIDLRDLNSKNDELIRKMVGYKSKRWEYEEEYRIITNFTGECFYPPNAIRGIYFGVRTPENVKEKIFNALKSRGIKFYQLIQKAKTYKFERELIKKLSEVEVTYMKKYHFQNKNIEFELVETKYAELIKRGDIILRINKIINEKEIQELSQYLRKQLFFNAESVLIQIYQYNQQPNNINWANSFFRNKKWEISLNEFVLQEQRF